MLQVCIHKVVPELFLLEKKLLGNHILCGHCLLKIYLCLFYACISLTTGHYGRSKRQSGHEDSVDHLIPDFITHSVGPRS